MVRFVYERCSGGSERRSWGALDREALFDQIASDLLERGDMSAVLQKAVSNGFPLSGRGRVDGTRQMIVTLRRMRHLKAQSHGLSELFEGISQQLEEVVMLECGELEELSREAQYPGGDADCELFQDALSEKRVFLNTLPPGIDKRMAELEGYEFTSSSARERFGKLRAWLSSQVVGSCFGRLGLARADLDGLGGKRLGECIEVLNALLERRHEAGRKGVDHEAGWFTSLVDLFGDLLGEGEQDLDGLLRRVASRLVAAEKLLESLPAGQRDEMRGLVEGALSGLGLLSQVTRLVGNLRRAFPDIAQYKSYPVSGARQLDLVDGTELMRELAEMEQLEQALTAVRSPGDLAYIDIHQVSRLLGPAGASSFQQLSDAGHSLETARLLEVRDNRWRLSPEGMRRMGAAVLADVFGSVLAGRSGEHELDSIEGVGHDVLEWTRPYEPGGPMNLNMAKTFKNALVRSASSHSGPYMPLRLAADDFEVDAMGDVVGASTVVALDISLSMPMHGSFVAAKKVAVAMHALVSTRFPHDFLGFVGFSKRAREIKPAEIAEISWDLEHGTNIQHALQLARRMLSGRYGTKQVLLITDGEPTSHFQPGGEVFFSYPPVPETIDSTMRELARCAAVGIIVNTFMLATPGFGGPPGSNASRSAGPHSGEFTERLVCSAAGRVMLTTPAALGRHVLADFITGRRAVRKY